MSGQIRLIACSARPSTTRSSIARRSLTLQRWEERGLVGWKRLVEKFRRGDDVGRKIWRLFWFAARGKFISVCPAPEKARVNFPTFQPLELGLSTLLDYFQPLKRGRARAKYRSEVPQRCSGSSLPLFNIHCPIWMVKYSRHQQFIRASTSMRFTLLFLQTQYLIIAVD